MKKIILILIAAAGLLCIVITSMAWYTGKQIEKNTVQQLNQLNQIIGQYYPNKAFTVSYQNYSRHIFSTTLDLIIRQNESSSIDNTLTLTLYHGPFPYNLIQQFNFIPHYAAGNIKLSPLSPVIATLIAENSAVDLEIYPINYHHSNPEFDVNSSAIQLKITADTLSLNGALQQIAIVKDDQQLLFNDIQLIMDHTIKINNISYLIDQVKKISIDHITLLDSSNYANNQLSFASTINSFSLNGHDQGKIQFLLGIDHVDFNIFEKIRSYQSLSSSISESPLSLFILFNDLNKFASFQPKLTINDLVWSKNDQQSELSLELELQEVLSDDFNNVSSLFLQSIKSYHSDLNLSLPMLKEVIQSTNPELTEQQIDMQVELLIDLSLFYFAKMSDQSITSQITYSVDEITINDQPLSKQQFLYWLHGQN